MNTVAEGTHIPGAIPGESHEQGVASALTGGPDGPYFKFLNRKHVFIYSESAQAPFLPDLMIQCIPAVNELVSCHPKNSCLLDYAPVGRGFSFYPMRAGLESNQRHRPPGQPDGARMGSRRAFRELVLCIHHKRHPMSRILR